MKIGQLTGFKVLSVDCNHVEGFQESGKNRDWMDLGAAISELETLYGIWATFDG